MIEVPDLERECPAATDGEMPSSIWRARAGDSGAASRKIPTTLDSPKPLSIRRSLGQCDGGLGQRPAPSARLFVFCEGESVAESILERTSSGNARVNDCSVHPLVQQLPFGGVGNSRMGKYHGHWGF